MVITSIQSTSAIGRDLHDPPTWTRADMCPFCPRQNKKGCYVLVVNLPIQGGISLTYMVDSAPTPTSLSYLVCAVPSKNVASVYAPTPSVIVCMLGVATRVFLPGRAWPASGKCQPLCLRICFKSETVLKSSGKHGGSPRFAIRRIQAFSVRYLLSRSMTLLLWSSGSTFNIIVVASREHF